MKILTNLKQFVTGARDQAKATVDELAEVEKAYAETSAEIQGLEGAKLALDMRPEAQQPGESREQHVRRLWDFQTERKAIMAKIAAASARQKELQVERTRLRAERERAAGAAVLAESSTDGAQALALLDSARRVVQTLEAKAFEAKATSGRLATERAEIALAAHSGDATAAARLDEINTALIKHGVETDGLAAAIEQAKRNVETSRAAVAHQESRRKAVEISRISRLVLAESAAFDAAAASVVEALQRREDLVTELAGLGVDSTLTNKLKAKPTIYRALVRAGLATFAGLDRINVHVQASLSNHDEAVLGRTPAGPAEAA